MAGKEFAGLPNQVSPGAPAPSQNASKGDSLAFLRTRYFREGFLKADVVSDGARSMLPKTARRSAHIIGTLTTRDGKSGNGVRFFSQDFGQIQLKSYWSSNAVRDGDTWKDRLPTWNIAPAPPDTDPSDGDNKPRAVNSIRYIALSIRRRASIVAELQRALLLLRNSPTEVPSTAHLRPLHSREMLCSQRA